MLISIVIPCLNEEDYIENCISSVLSFELPESCESEIFVMDGMSKDKTREIVKDLAQNHTNLKLLDNPGVIQAVAMNIALDYASGDYIMRLDAHAKYPSNYLKLCVEEAVKTGADNVGGQFITLPGGDSYSAKIVQALTTHKFGVGDSGFRTGEKADYADTVPYGFYKREVFEKNGNLDERLLRAQDYEFNQRIIASGGKVWRNPDIYLEYFNQPSLFRFLRKQFLLEAPYNAYLWYVAPYAFAPRHAITGVFFMGILLGILSVFVSKIIFNVFLGVMGLYFLLAFVSSVQQALRYKQYWLILTLPFSFFLFHFVHGSGIWVGLLKLVTGTSPVQKRNKLI